jgi:dolichyl-phosphate-mannose--protein O-mannosyl transferase
MFFQSNRKTLNTSAEKEPEIQTSQRQKTYMYCVLDHGNSQSTLTLKLYKDKPLQVQLASKLVALSTYAIDKQYDLVKTEQGIESQSVPPWLSQHAGLEFYDDHQQVAAIAFVGNPKIWLNPSISPATKQLLLLANYSLVMFNWLDDDWKQ